MRITNDNLIPVTIFTGFLGSGKTTIISNLIQDLQAMGQKAVFIKNELGNADLDTELIKNQNVTSKELLNGVMCHTMLGPLQDSIIDLIDKENPDRVIIEMAGTEDSADPEALARVIDNHPRLVRDGIITVIDVLNFEGYEKLDDYHRGKALFVDLIVFNKVEQVDMQRKKTVVAYVREYNEGSPIVEAPEGRLDPSLAFGLQLPTQQKGKKHAHKHINAFSYTSDKTFDKAKLEQVFAEFPKNVIRFKGSIKTQDGVEIVNGVYKRFDWIVPKKSNSQETKLIIIGYDVKKNRSEIVSLVEGCRV